MSDLSDERLVTLLDHDGVEPQEITCAELESLVGELQRHRIHGQTDRKPMKDLIEALTILAKYGDPYAPTHCEHDVLYVCIDPDQVSEADKARLAELSFRPDTENGGGFRSYRFGSC